MGSCGRPVAQGILGRAPRTVRSGPSCSLTSPLQVTGSIFLFHLVVHIIAVSINPAEKSVHQKNYLEPMPVFDRSKHAHVIQDLYCHLCETNV